MKLYLASPMGFCAGVERAVLVLEELLKHLGAPIYVRHEIVHNRQVVESFKKKGVFFLEDIDEVPKGSVLVLSAHGVSKAVFQKAKERELRLFNATCPLVGKVHLRVQMGSKEGKDGVLIGHKDHVEVQGTMGHFDNSMGGKFYLVEKEEDVAHLDVQQPENLFVVSQTTLSVSDTSFLIQKLQKRYPKIQIPKNSDICYATENRQKALFSLLNQVELVIVIGSEHSSNSQRLVEISRTQKSKVYRIETEKDLQSDWFLGVNSVGLTAGASTPTKVISSVIKKLEDMGAILMPFEKIEEGITFPLPKEIRELKNNLLSQPRGGDL